MNQIISRTKFSLGVLTATLILTSQLPKADAVDLDLNPPILDAKQLLSVSWKWNPEANDNDSPILDNWLVRLETIDKVDSWHVRLDLQHKTDPHPELGENKGGNPVVEKIFIFNKELFGLFKNAGAVIDETFFVDHLPGHIDFYHFNFNRGINPEDTVITLKGVHQVPEPLTILGTGVVLGAIPVLKKKYAKRNKKKDAEE